MRKISFLPILFLLVGCGPSDVEKQNIATITCNVIAETNKDPAMKIKEMNTARENLSAEPYLFGVDKINESLEYDLCENLVLLSEPEYEKVLLAAKEEKRKARIEARKAKAELEYQRKREIVEEQISEQKELIITGLQDFPESYCEDTKEFIKWIETLLNNELYSGPFVGTPSCEYWQTWEDEDFLELLDTYNEHNADQICDTSYKYLFELAREFCK